MSESNEIEQAIEIMSPEDFEREFLLFMAEYAAAKVLRGEPVKWQHCKGVFLPGSEWVGPYESLPWYKPGHVYRIVENKEFMTINGKTVVKPRLSDPESPKQVFVVSANPQVDPDLLLRKNPTEEYDGSTQWEYEEDLSAGSLVYDKFSDLKAFREAVLGIE